MSTTVLPFWYPMRTCRLAKRECYHSFYCWFHWFFSLPKIILYFFWHLLLHKQKFKIFFSSYFCRFCRGLHCWQYSGSNEKLGSGFQPNCCCMYFRLDCLYGLRHRKSNNLINAKSISRHFLQWKTCALYQQDIAEFLNSAQWQKCT